jgi:hypothetical protein
MVLSVGLLLPMFLLSTGCGPANDAPAAKIVTTQWKYTPKPVVGNVAIGDSKGVIIQQTGDQVLAIFYVLKDGDGFVIEKQVSQGKYYPDKHLLVLPIGPISPAELDQLIAINGYRIEIPFDPQNPPTDVLHSKWVGEGPMIEMDFVRIQP